MAHAAVRIAEHEALGARVPRRFEHREREPGVGTVAVEKVLGVEEYPAPFRPEERDRIADHRHGFLEVGPERLGHMEVPGLPDDADDLGSGIEDIAKDRRLFRRLSRLARHAERRERGVL